MHRVFIFGDLHFPRGGASANYVQYMAGAIATQNYEVVVISTASKDYKDKKTDQGVCFEPICCENNKVIHHFTVNYFWGYEVVRILKKYHADKDDLIIAYCTNPYALKMVLRYAHKTGMKSGACITERHEKKIFTGKHGEKKYRNYLNATVKELPKYDYVFPISNYLKKFYDQLGARTMVLPVLADLKNTEISSKEKNGKIKYIFPANGIIKDNLYEMIRGAIQTYENGSVDIEIHITGMQKEKLVNICKESEPYLDSLIICHGWLEYEELVELYRTVDYLFIARSVNQTSKANFPSKVAEVMCYGVIPVVSRVGDYTSTFLTDKHDSFIFDGCSVEECTEILTYTAHISREELKKIAQNARDTVEKKLDWEKWGRKIIRCMNENN